MNDLGYRITLALLYALALLPMRVLYVLSDFLYLIVYHVARYRRKLVRENLAACFPDKNETDRRDIEKKFYRNFTDYIVETVKLLHISDAEIKRRMQFENIELIDRLTAEGRSVVIYFSHCGNWEWATSMTLHVRHDADSHVEYCQVYRPLRSEITDRLMLRLRSRFGSLSFPKSSVLRDLIKLRRNGVTSVTGFMSDQKPSHGDPGYITMFLNHPTAFITGTATVATRMASPVVYWSLTKPSRGHYRVEIRLLSPDASQTTPDALTAAYASGLEADITADPSLWLWTHKRWKRRVTLPASTP